MGKWHFTDIETLERELNTDVVAGLSIREARNRLEKEKKLDGGERSSLFVPKNRSIMQIMISSFLNPTLLLLAVMSFLTAIFGETLTGVAVFIMAMASTVICGVVSVRTQKRIGKMRAYASPMVRLRRGDVKYSTDGRNAVVGDIIILSKGDLLPCDARLISSDGLVVKELIYTRRGIRNRVVKKDNSVLYSASDSVGAPDAQNMLYTGSAIVAGHAEALVVATGNRVYLAEHLGCGELAEGREDFDGVKTLKPILHRVGFLCTFLLAILALVSIITLKQNSFIDNFLMLLASFAMISLEFLRVGANYIFAINAEKLSKVRRKKKDSAACVRDIHSMDTLANVTDLVLLGRVALTDGIYHVSKIYTAGGVSERLLTERELDKRILTCIYTYIRALRESGVVNEFVKNSLPDALDDYLKRVEFDENGASLITKSLYFVNDPKGENGFACAETTMSVYRTAITFDDSILSFCDFLRAQNGLGVMPIAEALPGLRSFVAGVRECGGRCLYVVSENEGRAVLEGVLNLAQRRSTEIPFVMDQLDSLGICATVMMLDENEETLRLITSPEFSKLVSGRIALASIFKEKNMDIADSVGEYSAYIGFSAEEYCDLIRTMRDRGSTVAAYGLDNRYYEIMAHANVALSCDFLRYSSDKYRESLYENLPPEGRDTNLRCSQQTRLLSKVIVRRAHDNGGGLGSVLNSLMSARVSYLSLSCATLNFVFLMSTLLPVVAINVLLGGYFLNAIQVTSLATVGALLSMLAFSDAAPKTALINSGVKFSRYPADILKEKLPSIIARASVALTVTFILKILDGIKAFGEKAAYEMPMYVTLLAVLFADLFMVNDGLSRRGIGRRRCWIKVIIAYAVLLSIGALTIQNPFGSQLLVNGIGGLEFIIVPIYALLYFIAVFVGRLIEKNRKKL